MIAFGLPPALAARGLALRPITPDDQSLLLTIYSSTRTEELAPIPWSAAQKQAFLLMQFMAQHAHYQQHYADGTFWVIEQHGVPVGRLYLFVASDEVRVVDIALLPEYRAHGVGTALLHAVIAFAEAHRLPVRIHVEYNNPALRLYGRLGFREIGATGVYYLLERAA